MVSCLACHRPLTAPVSRRRGYGEACDPDPDERRRVAEAMRVPAVTTRRAPRQAESPQLPLALVVACPAQPSETCVEPSRVDTCCDIPWGACVACGLGLVGECVAGAFW